MKLSDNFLQELMFKNDIVDIISEYTTLKRSGRNMVGLCPFHNEKTPSFNVYPEDNSFYCFGCGVGGNLISFIKKAENIEFLDAVKLLAQRAGISLPEDNYDNSLLEKKNRIYEINRASAKFYHSKLYSYEGKNALSYLRNRGLTETTIKHFGLGYSPDSRFELSNFLSRQGFKENDIVSANLAFFSKKGNIIDRFYNRIMFPIIDVRGNVIAFGGRIMTDQKPKYLNTSDTIVFKKSSNLFSLNFAKKNCSDHIILAEGYMDVIALNQAGFPETVATLGTSLTTDQARILKSYTKEVIISYDSDEAGQNATSRAINILRNVGLPVGVLTIPKGKDPDEFLKTFKDQGHDRFKKLISDSKNDIDYRLNKIKSKLNIQSTEGKISYLKESIKVLSTINDNIEREVYAGKLSTELDVEKNVVIRQINSLIKKHKKFEHKKEFKSIQENLSAFKDKINPQKSSNLRAAHAEETLISFLINNQEYSNLIFSELPPEKFITSFNKKIYNYIKEKIESKNSITITDFNQTFSDNEISKIMKILVSDITKTKDLKIAKDCVNVILEENKKLELNKNSSQKLSDIENYMSFLKSRKK